MKNILPASVLLLLFLSCQTVSSDNEPVLTQEESPSSVDQTETKEAESNDESSLQEDVQALTADSLPFPALFNNNQKPFELQSFVDGTVLDISKDELGLMKIELEAEMEYYFEGKSSSLNYVFVFGGMEEVRVKKGDSISPGVDLGTASSSSFITVHNDTVEPFLIRMTSQIPVRYNDRWYFSPDWVISGHTAWLSFRQVDDFYGAVEDFYRRWAIEENEAIGSTIHYFHNLDRIRAKVRLNEYPLPAVRDQAISMVERGYYNNMSIFVFESVLKDNPVEDHDIVIYWQKGFDQYLADEYKLGEELYIYASIYAIDHDEKQILVCVRDFSLINDEKIVDERMSGLLR